VEIARAIVSNPSLLVLDEPTAGLTAAEVQNLVRTFAAVRAEGRAIAIVEHNLTVVSQIADEVMIMHAGEMIARGHMETIMHDQRVRKLYFGYAA
jgi:branched-chain amino acid transport system ATP-binding protein